ncbi:MAG TPA: hypothetical protein VIM64_19640 [Puia sp.]
MSLKFPFILLGVIWSGIAWGQKITLWNFTHRAKWPFENYYRFVVKDIPCSRIVFKSDNGKFDQNGCELFYYPDTVGMTTFKAYEKDADRLRLVDSVEVRVDEYKEPEARLGTKSGGIISKAEVLAMEGPNLRMYFNDFHSEQVVLISYTVIVLHGDSVRSAHNTGDRYSEETRSLLEGLQSKDKLIFVNIEATDGRKRSLLAKPMEFKIE